MYLIHRVRLMTKNKDINFQKEDLGDKIRLKLMVSGKKVEAGHIMKGEKSNTSISEMEETLLLTYCRRININV